MVVSDLVGILTRSWYFDGARPIGVHVAELVCEVFYVVLRQVFGFVETDVEVSWGNTSLGGLLRDEEEVEADVVLLILDQALIDDTSWWWIADIAAAFGSLDEHTLVDPLVYDDQSNWWDTGDLVVEWPEHLLELPNFFFDDLVSHTLADSISVDDDPLWILVVMVLGKRLYGLLHTLIKISLHKFLPLFLYNES